MLPVESDRRLDIQYGLVRVAIDQMSVSTKYCSCGDIESTAGKREFMRNFTVFAFALVLVCASAANAAITCSDSNPRNVTSLNTSGGCTIGGTTFSNFQVLPAAGNPTPEIDLVSAVIDSMGFVNLQFNPNMSAPPGGGFEDIHFSSALPAE